MGRTRHEVKGPIVWNVCSYCGGFYSRKIGGETPTLDRVRFHYVCMVHKYPDGAHMIARSVCERCTHPLLQRIVKSGWIKTGWRNLLVIHIYDWYMWLR